MPNTHTNTRWLPVGFVIAACMLFAFWVLLLLTLIVHKTYVGGETAAQGSRLESVWAWLLLGGLGWALVNWYWAGLSLSNRFVFGYFSHIAIAIGCGLIALGIHSVMVSRSLTQQPLVLDYSNQGGGNASTAVSVKEPAGAITGDAAEGRKVFSTTCITCHGPIGKGLPNLAPSLVGSPFIASSDIAAVANVIRTGRGLGEPNNKSGKVMPARGGNPFLTEEQIAHLAAFVRAIQDDKGATTGDTGAPSPQLARWVVPLAPNPPRGFRMEAVNAEKNGGLALGRQLADRRQFLMRGLTLGLIFVHGAFLFGLVILSTNLILPRLLSGHQAVNPSLGKLSYAGWAVATAAWLLVAWFCFWWS